MTVILTRAEWRRLPRWKRTGIGDQLLMRVFDRASGEILLAPVIVLPEPSDELTC
jgi:hypothetical protein